jgi:hypothetical protein
MLAWYHRAAAIVGALALGIVSEITARYITGEFAIVRAAIILTGAFVLLAVIMAVLRRTPRKRLFVDFAFLLFGISATSLGLGILLSNSVDSAGAVHLLKFVLLSLGITMSVLASYAIFLDATGRDIDFVPIEARPRMARALAVGGSQVMLTRLAELREEDDVVVQAVCAQLDVGDLHYVAYYVGGRCVFYADVLDQPELNTYFLNQTRDTRRDHYERAGRQVLWLIQALDRSLERVEGGILIRTVLDVREGAIYYFRVQSGVDLIGVTLTQDKVPEADEKLAALTAHIGRLPRGGSMSRNRIRDVGKPGSAGNVVPLHPRTDPRLSSGRLNPEAL